MSAGNAQAKLEVDKKSKKAAIYMKNDEQFWRILIRQCQQEQTGNEQPQDKGAIVRLADFLIMQAIEQRASDLHIEPQNDTVRFRLRVDGLLQELPFHLPLNLASMLTSRLKVMANMDIAKHQQPQDGAFVFQEQGHHVEVRASSMPAYDGEVMVLRLMNLQENLMTLDELGFTPANEQRFRELIQRPSGLIIVAGPMGSGKSTTLYAALRELNTPDKNWLTLEDPIERHIPGVNQVQLNPKAGLDYSTGLRAALRQDAQGILLGEIRDEETAEMAVRMALTGHLLLTTMHTENAVAAVFRLLEMGIPPYLLAATLSGVLAQRLVRRRSNSETYQGRLALHELLIADQSIRNGILKGQSREQLETLAKAAGMKTLWDDGQEKAAAGLTSLDEVRRVYFREAVH